MKQYYTLQILIFLYGVALIMTFYNFVKNIFSDEVYYLWRKLIYMLIICH